MREKEDLVTEAVDALTVLAEKFERGQTIPWLDVEKISGPRYDNRPRHIIRKWRKRLEKEREIVTLTHASVGVWLLTHAEVAEHIPRIRQKKAYRQINRAIKQTDLVDHSRLPLAQRRLLVAQIANMKSQRLTIGRSRRQLAENVTVGNPRRTVTAT